MEKSVDPCEVNWKNMHIKGGERLGRIILFIIGLVTLIYISFLFQVEFAELKNLNDRFEHIDCNVYKHENTH